MCRISFCLITKPTKPRLTTRTEEENLPTYVTSMEWCNTCEMQQFLAGLFVRHAATSIFLNHLDWCRNSWTLWRRVIFTDRKGKVMFSQVSVCRSYGYSFTVRPCYCAVGTHPIEMLSVFLLLIKKMLTLFWKRVWMGNKRWKCW